MRLKQISKWIEEGGDLPQDLTPKEKEHLEGLGWKENRQWYENGQLRWERNHLHNMLHGVHRQWHKNGQIELEEEWFYGNRIK